MILPETKIIFTKSGLCDLLFELLNEEASTTKEGIEILIDTHANRLEDNPI